MGKQEALWVANTLPYVYSEIPLLEKYHLRENRNIRRLDIQLDRGPAKPRLISLQPHESLS